MIKSECDDLHWKERAQRVGERLIRDDQWHWKLEDAPELRYQTYDAYA